MCLLWVAEHLTLDHVVPVSQEALTKLKISFVRVMSAIKTSLTKTGGSWYTRQTFYDPFKEQKIKEWQNQNIGNFSNYIETKRAGLVLTRNNFVYKKTE